MAKAGLPARCTPHGLRKRCLTDVANEGKTIHEIMSVSGHLTDHPGMTNSPHAGAPDFTSL